MPCRPIIILFLTFANADFSSTEMAIHRNEDVLESMIGRLVFMSSAIIDDQTVKAVSCVKFLPPPPAAPRPAPLTFNIAGEKIMIKNQ